MEASSSYKLTKQETYDESSNHQLPCTADSCDDHDDNTYATSVRQKKIVSSGTSLAFTSSGKRVHTQYQIQQDEEDSFSGKRDSGKRVCLVKPAHPLVPEPLTSLEPLTRLKRLEFLSRITCALGAASVSVSFGKKVHLELQRGNIPNSSNNSCNKPSQLNPHCELSNTDASNDTVPTTSAIKLQQKNAAPDKNQVGSDISAVLHANRNDTHMQDPDHAISNKTECSDKLDNQSLSDNLPTPEEGHEMCDQAVLQGTSNLPQKLDTCISSTADKNHPVMEDVEKDCSANTKVTSETPAINKFTPTEAIINFIYEDNIYGNDGIIEAAGDAVKQEYEVNRMKGERDVKKGVVVTGAGNLPSKAIFHVTVFPHQAKFRTALHTALRLADRRGLRSTAVPALSCYLDEDKALIDRYLKVFYKLEEQSRLLCLQSIVIVNNTEEKYKYHDKQLTLRGEVLKSY